MSYFYADRTDKSGNRLLTSYGKEAQATKYGGPTARVFSGEKYLNISPEGTASIGNEGEMLLRTLMVKPDGKRDTDETGKFVVFARVNDVWSRTPFRYKTYSMANSAVKSALINLYDACAVVEVEDEEVVESIPAEDIDLSV